MSNSKAGNTEKTETGIDSDACLIGDTGFDMYRWTFTEGKRARGTGWTIAVPDGFVQRESDDVVPITGEKRLFELVPAPYKNEKDYGKISVRIVPGAETMAVDTKPLQMVHPKAKAALAGMSAMLEASVLAHITGMAPGILSYGGENTAAYMLVQSTLRGSYSYQSAVIFEEKKQELRVQTQYMTYKQKHYMDCSVQEWLKTFVYDGHDNDSIVRTKLEEKDCFNEILKGNTAKLEEAVEQAKTEQKSVVVGKLKTMGFMKQNVTLDEYSGESIESLLEDTMEVVLFFLQKADQLVDKLLKASVPASVFENVMLKLSEIYMNYVDIIPDSIKIKIDIPEPVLNILDKWKKLAPDVFDEEKLNLCEHEKATDEREESDKEVAEIISGIRKKMKDINSRFKEKVRDHTRMIEMHTFEEPWDPEFFDYCSMLEDDMAELGSDTELLLSDIIESYNKVKEILPPEKTLEILNIMEEVIDCVENSTIYNDALNKSFEYTWKLDVTSIKCKLEMAKRTIR